VSIAAYGRRLPIGSGELFHSSRLTESAMTQLRRGRGEVPVCQLREGLDLLGPRV
jgi:hypothetical protein